MKTFYQRIQNWKYSEALSCLLILFSMFILDYGFRFIYSHLYRDSLWNPKSFLFTLLYSLLLISLYQLFPVIIRRIFIIIFHLFFSVLILVHAGVYSATGRFFSFSMMGFADDGFAFFSWEYIHLRKLLILIIAFSIVLSIAAALFSVSFSRLPKKGKIIRIIAVFLIILCVLGIVLIHQSMLKSSDNYTWDVSVSSDLETKTVIYKDFSESIDCFYMTGLYQYTVRDFCVSNGIGADFIEKSNLDTYFSEKEASVNSDYKGILKGQNCLMIMMESIDTWMVTPEYMPTLYALQQNGVNFTNHYTPIFLAGATFNTEIMSLTGQIPPRENFSNSEYSSNCFSCGLPSLFKESGYTVRSFHSASPQIYGRGQVHENLGFESYSSYVEMNMQDYMLDSQMIGGYSLMTEGSPFFSFIITYSGHGPYTSEMDNISSPHYEAAQKAVKERGEDQLTDDPALMDQYIRAVAHAMETDLFLNELVKKLEEDSLLENTALLLYGDHYCKYISDKEFIKQIKGVTSENEEELYHTPCILYSASLGQKEITKATCTADLCPTLVNLFQLEFDLKYYPGIDIFSSEEGRVILPNYTWFNETYSNKFISSTDDPVLLEKSRQARIAAENSMNTFRLDYFAQIS